MSPRRGTLLSSGVDFVKKTPCTTQLRCDDHCQRRPAIAAMRRRTPKATKTRREDVLSRKRPPRSCVPFARSCVKENSPQSTALCQRRAARCKRPPAPKPAFWFAIHADVERVNHVPGDKHHGGDAQVVRGVPDLCVGTIAVRTRLRSAHGCPVNEFPTHVKKARVGGKTHTPLPAIGIAHARGPQQQPARQRAGPLPGPADQ